MPFQKGYQNNYAGDTGAQAAGRFWRPRITQKSGDYYARDGKVAGFALTSFGSEAVTRRSPDSGAAAEVRRYPPERDNQPQSNSTPCSARRATKQSSPVGAFCSDLASSAPYFFTTEVFGVSDPEVDKLIEKLQNTEKEDERIKIANEAEKLYYEEGRSVSALRKRPDVRRCQG